MEVLGRKAPAWLGSGALACSLVIGAGCSGVGGDKEFLNYALYDYGADINSSGQNGERSADSLIDGNADSATWEDGDGWEVTFTRREQRDSRGGGGGAEDNIAKGSAWALVRFAEPSVINRVVITALHTEAMPFPGYREAELQTYDAKDGFSPWQTVARVTQGKVVVPGRQSPPAGPVTTFRFNPVKTDQIRFIVYEMLDSKNLAAENTYQRQQGASRDQQARRSYTRVTRSQETTVRLLEIEATGTEGIEVFVPREPTEAENILLQDLTGTPPSESSQ